MRDVKENVREPLIRIVKRTDIDRKKIALIYAIAIISGLIVSSIICSLFGAKSPLGFFSSLFSGSLGTSRRIWLLLQDTALLLGVSAALVPAFKMKFWNLGANGQILIGCLASVACMNYLGGKVSDAIIIPLMIVTSIVAGTIWAMIPAIFKALFNTNESLFTLMMNYIAEGFVSLFIALSVKSGSGVLDPLPYGHLPNLVNDYLLIILLFFIICALMYVYLRYSKQGYEISVVGESQKTARYIGINVKWVTIRTLMISGALCGIVGLMLGGSINHTISTSSTNNMGFTAIMTSWLAAFNPIMMILTCFFITFISKGMVQVRKDFKFTNDAISNIVIGLIYFFVIACSFFITYKVIIRKNSGRVNSDSVHTDTAPTQEVPVEEPSQNQNEEGADKC